MNHDNPDKTQGFREKRVDRPLQGAETDRPGRLSPLKPEPRWCGCIKPIDYPKIDIHLSGCLRQRAPEVDTPWTGDNIPKDESQGWGAWCTSSPTPTHQTFFVDGELISNTRGSKRLWKLLDRRFSRLN